MFVNGDAVSLVIKLLLVGSLLLCLALVAHIVWIGRLARSHALGRLGPAARTIVLALAAATPVISFYGVGTALRLHRLAVHRGRAAAARAVLGTMGALIIGVLDLLVIAQLPQLVPGLRGSDVLSRVPGMLLVSIVPCAILGMSCRVLFRSKLARLGWTMIAGAATACLFLLV